MPTVQSIIVRWHVVTISAVYLDLIRYHVIVEASWPDSLDGSEHQRRLTFDTTAVLAACAALGSRTIANAGQFQTYLVDLTKELIANRWPELPPPK